MVVHLYNKVRSNSRVLKIFFFFEKKKEKHRCKESENSLIAREREGKQDQGFKEDTRMCVLYVCVFLSALGKL